jgi:Kef-type K+ transport system membrane component KefB
MNLPNATSLVSDSLTKLNVEQVLLPVLVQIAIILVAARLFGVLARRVGQPRVVGEIVAGLILGPSFFGWVNPDAFRFVFQPSLPNVEPEIANALIGKILSVIAQLGLIFLMFLVGLELELSHIRERGKSVLVIALAGLVLPFILGAALTPLIVSTLGIVSESQSHIPLALFVGLTFSVTALPVLGRILLELGITRTRIGAVSLVAAGASDACGWVALATIVAIVESKFELLPLFRISGFSLLYVGVMIAIFRPRLQNYFTHAVSQNEGSFGTGPFAVVLVGLLLATSVSSWIGIFAVFGAFLFGAILADQPQVREALHAKLHDFVTVFFVPIFFAYTGLRTDITAIRGWEMWALCLVVIAVAVVGKLVGCGLAARVSGFTWKESTLIGAMMNARGLMALVVINIGAELGVIPRSLFCILVVMAIVTTMLTTPLLLTLQKGTELEEPIHRAGF